MGTNSERCRNKSLHPSHQADDVLQVQKPYQARTASPALDGACSPIFLGFLAQWISFRKHYGNLLEHLVIMVHLVPEVSLSPFLCWFMSSISYSALSTPSHCWTAVRFSGQIEKRRTSVHLTEVVLSERKGAANCWWTQHQATEKTDALPARLWERAENRPRGWRKCCYGPLQQVRGTSTRERKQWACLPLWLVRQLWSTHVTP